MLGPVDQGHLHRRPPQPPCGEQPGETAADDHHPAGARCCGHGSPRPFVASYGLRALIVMMIARAPAGIALMKVLPAPEPGRPRPSSLRRGDAERPSGGEGGPASLERTNRHTT